MVTIETKLKIVFNTLLKQRKCMMCLVNFEDEMIWKRMMIYENLDYRTYPSTTKSLQPSPCYMGEGRLIWEVDVWMENDNR